MKQMTNFVGELEEQLRTKTNQVDRLKRQLGEEGPRNLDGSATDITAEGALGSHELVQSLRDELHLMELKR